MISEDQWTALGSAAKAGTGAAWIRIAADSGHDLFVAVGQPGSQRSLWYDFPSDALPGDLHLPSLRSVGLDVRPKDDKPNIMRCSLTLQADDLRSVFRALVDDIVAAVSSARDDETGVAAFARRLERWKRLLRPDSTTGLSVLDRRGLFGELRVLYELLDTSAPPGRVTSSWTGPYGNHQDFQNSKGAIEVKATVIKQPQTLVITSERELDDTGVDVLFLTHVSLDERRGGSGLSLNDIVEDVRLRIGDNPFARMMFDDALLHRGFLPEHARLYEEPRYSIREEHSYRVVPGFPRIVESGLVSGVGDVTYRVQVAALSDFAVDHGEAIRLIGEA